MNVKQKIIQNEYIKISEYNINLKTNEIYLIDGKNGTGKTTLMESLVFGSLDVEFETENEKLLYNSERGRLFSFFSQHVAECSGSVYEFLKKNNKDINKKDAELLLIKYNCDSINVNDKFLSLSGGEKARVSLISTLSKQTKYIFLDEPSNDLDKDSVAWLTEILKNCKDKCIVIISHEKALRDIATKTIIFKSEKLNITTKRSIKIYDRRDQDAVKATNYIFRNKINIIYTVLLLLSIAVLCNLLSVLEKSIYVTEKLPSKDNILLYIMDETYDELNRKYAEGRGLEVDEINYDKVFCLSQLRKMSENEKIKEIYIRDDSLFYDYYVEDNVDNENNSIFSIPEVIYEDETFLNWMAVSEFACLVEGRLPKDNAKEVVVSENLLLEYDIGIDDAIGCKIDIKGESYEIVGIGIEDVFLVSYEKNNNLGIYYFDEGTFDSFYNHIKEYYNSTIYKEYSFESLLIVTEYGCEKEVLEELICEYPATNFYSHDFAYVLNREFNKVFYLLLLVVVLICSILYGASLSMMLGGHIKKYSNKIYDFTNYYVNNNIRNMYIKKYIFFIVVNLIISFMLAMLLVFIKDLENISILAIYFYAIFVQIPSLAVVIKNKSQSRERNINDC